jgi:TDG/mug DNA glycosylase family protein
MAKRAGGGEEPHRPTRAELAAARGRRIPDVLAPDLAVVFCGINPSLYSAAVGHQFARPGNRFWTALRDAGFTDRLLSPAEDRELLRCGCGVTNLAPRATALADDVPRRELARGARVLERKLRRLRPRCVALLGLGAYRTAFGRPAARIGPQEEAIAGVPLWVLPNPSGRTAAYQRRDFARLFGDLLRSVSDGQREARPAPLGATAISVAPPRSLRRSRTACRSAAHSPARRR